MFFASTNLLRVKGSDGTSILVQVGPRRTYRKKPLDTEPETGVASQE